MHKFRAHTLLSMEWQKLYCRSMSAALLFAVAVLGGSVFAHSVADEANKELPAWLRFNGLYRVRFEGFLNRNFAAGQSDDHILNRLRIGLKAQPTSWMKFAFEGQDARIYFNRSVPTAPPHANPMDLRVGYLELGDIDSKPAGLRVGRQELEFGEGRLVGAFNWINVGRSFDAVRATLRHNQYRLDLFASSVVNPASGKFDRRQAGNNLHGLFGRVEKLVPGAVIEPYVLWRLAPRQVSEDGVRANLDFQTFGVRWTGNARGALDYGAEMARQAGSLGPDKVRAWAGHWTVGYAFSGITWRPRFSAEYNYASGDKDPHDHLRGTFDSLYPTPHDKYGLSDQVGWRNIHNIRLGWDAKPRSKLSVATNYHTWWLASARDALYAAPGVVLVRQADGSAGTHVGQEIDFQSSFALSMQMQIGAGIGHIFPGEFLKKTTPGKGYTYPFVMLNYTF